jgi:hypothetical protein
MTEEPTTTITVCSACESSTGGTKSCSGCKDAHYCSSNCQKTHWPTHKSKCKVIQALIKVTNKELPLSERVLVLQSDIFTAPENFSIMINNKHHDIASLILEDIDVNFGIEAMRRSGGAFPQICWTNYLLSTIFRGKMTGATGFSGSNMSYFIQFLNRPRPGPQAYGDVFSMIMSVSVLVITCLLRGPDSTNTSGMAREKIAKPILRHLGSLLCSPELCAFVLTNDFAFENTITGLKVLMESLRDADRVDPGSAMEGLVFQAVAIINLQANQINHELGKKVKSNFDSLLQNEYKRLYNSVAIPYARGEIAKFSK